MLLYVFFQQIRDIMKYFIILSLFLTGCATTDYTINNQTETGKIVLSIVSLGLIAKALSHNGSNNCTTTIKSSTGQITGTTTKPGSC